MKLPIGKLLPSFQSPSQARRFTPAGFSLPAACDQAAEPAHCLPGVEPTGGGDGLWPGGGLALGAPSGFCPAVPAVSFLLITLSTSSPAALTQCSTSSLAGHF